jgi:ethanolamine utilization protein EutQ (cupin superfamily)
MFCSIPVAAQKKDDAQKQREEFEQKVQEKLTENIQSFISQLQIDDFQKEIIKQKLHSFYVEQKAIYMNAGLMYFEREERLTALNNSHFTDIKNMLSDDTMTQINVFIKDAGSTLEKEKKKKKKKKKDE